MVGLVSTKNDALIVSGALAKARRPEPDARTRPPAAALPRRPRRLIFVRAEVMIMDAILLVCRGERSALAGPVHQALLDQDEKAVEQETQHGDDDDADKDIV